MPQHFQAIGFDIPDAAALKKLAHKATEQGLAIVSRRPGMPEAAFLWDLGRGLQVWVMAKKSRLQDEEYEIISCLPGFRPDRSSRLRAYRLAMKADSPGEVLLHGLLGEGVKIELSLLDLVRNDLLPVRGGELDLILAGLAIEARIWGPGEDVPQVIQMQDNEGLTQTVNSFFFPLDSDCHCELLGSIEGVQDLVNFHTGARLWALGVKTSEISLQVLAPGKTFDRRPETGDHFHGTIWFQGQQI